MDNNHAFQSSKFLRALLVLFFMTVSVQWTFAQLDLNMSRTTLGTVIEQIKTQSKYEYILPLTELQFVYQKHVIPPKSLQFLMASIFDFYPISRIYK